MENDRDTSLQSWEFLTLFLPRRYVPEVTWRQSFVPVYREVDPAAPLDSDPFLPARNAGVSPIKLIGETFRLNNSPQGSSRSLGDAKRDSEDAAFFDAL